MLELLSKKIATLCGLGRKTKFPGTLASFVALIFSFLSYYFWDKNIYIILFFIFLLIGWWAINKIQTMAEQKDQKDYAWIVIDEWVGMWIAGFFLFELSPVLNLTLLSKIGIALLAFIIFRIIDIFKIIPPIGNIDTKEPQSAMYVILDDCVAGCYTYVILSILFGLYNLHYLYVTFLILLAPMIANMTPVLLRGIKRFEKPISTEIFGQNKTWRGLFGGILAGTFFYYIFSKIGLIGSNQNINSIIAIGFLLSFGALSGDLVKSYLKRKIGIPEGESWIPFDQIDYVLGVIIVTYPIYHYPLRQTILMLIIGGILSALAHRAGYIMKMINTKQ
ncbi:MAG TPA: phosphatidylglycerophosphatase A [Candidatus Paceibacterota bacterium]|nr:phosphatidylglycerophosphatase A [Candidatus Paceibacterota bacterium]